MPVILWTDALIWLLVGCAIAFGLYTRRREHLRAPWRRVARSRLGMASAVVLLLFVLLGMLDSLHFHPRLSGTGLKGDSRYATEVQSVLDWIAGPLRTNVEKTYSAPFATHLYAKETIQKSDGREVREYPRLDHAGTHLQDAHRDRCRDIVITLTRCVAEGLGASAVLALIVLILLARRRGAPLGATTKALLTGRLEVPWGTILLTATALTILGFAAARLGVKYHILGTDKVGQDVFYQAVKSIRTGLVIGTLTTLVMLPIAILLGIMAGYFRGWTDDIIQYVYTTLNSIPGVLLIAAAILMLQVYMANHADKFESLVLRGDMRLLFLCIILGMTSWTGLCRLLRGEALKLREMEYVQAAQALGVNRFKIILRHLLPNVMHLVLIAVVLDFSRLVLAEAVLSYINIGVDPSTNSWGNMINSARLEMAREPVVWWSLTAAFVFMFTLVLAANLFADAVRDAFDPRLRGK